MPSNGPLLVDGKPTPFRGDADSVLSAMLRAGKHPTGGGTLCADGDCGNCVVEVDGVAYTRACQIAARAGMEVRTQADTPPIHDDRDKSPEARRLRHLHCDVVVIGGGRSGLAEAIELAATGRRVVLLERNPATAERDRARALEAGLHDQQLEVLTADAAAIYPGPLVLGVEGEAGGGGRTTVRIRPDEVVVATGSVELHAVCPGTELQGVLTPRAAQRLQASGIDLGNVAWIRHREGSDPAADDFEPPLDGAQAIVGRPVAFESHGDGPRVGLVRVENVDGATREHACDTVVVDLGLMPRNQLARLGTGLPVRSVGSAAAADGDLPPAPCSRIGGVFCPCSDVTVDDLDSVFDRGFHELELVKRSTLCGTGTCQGAVCTPHVRAYLQSRGAELQPAFTARPVAHALTVAEAAAGSWLHPSARTPLHDLHRRAGAELQRAGGWWRPWVYSDTDEEVDAVRTRVSLGDVSTLGKFLVGGPDAQKLLERVAPVDLGKLRPGRCRYALLLDERGAVLDDGMICRLRDDDSLAGGAPFYLTLTSGGASFSEMWLRDWADSGPFDVRLLNQSESLAAINVTGPEAARLLVRAGARSLPLFARSRTVDIAGVPCRVVRLSFTGELSYELHHEAPWSEHLWRTLLDLGESLGVMPHGLEALQRLRLEKGHLIVGQDTAFDATPRRLRHDWAVTKQRNDFVGHDALARTAKIPTPRTLVGLTLDAPAPTEGAVIWNGQADVEGGAPASASASVEDTRQLERYVGYVTSAAVDHRAERSVALGWLRDDVPLDDLWIEGRQARVTDLPFLDPDNERPRVRIDVKALAAEESRSAPRAAPAAPTPATQTMQRLSSVRISARPGALDEFEDRLRSLCRLRLAGDELLLVETRGGGSSDRLVEALHSEGHVEFLRTLDSDALAVAETGFVGRWMTEAAAHDLLERCSELELPELKAADGDGTEQTRPVFVQGAVAELPAKIWFGQPGVLLAIAEPWAAALERRIAEAEPEDDG